MHMNLTESALQLHGQLTFPTCEVRGTATAKATEKAAYQLQNNPLRILQNISLSYT